MSQNGNGHNGTYTARQFIDAIPKSGGIISTIAKRVGCAWNTAKKYIEKHPTVLRAYQDEREKILDLAEQKVIQAIDEGDMGTVRWYLSTLGKDRGYTERRNHEVDVTSGGKPIKTYIAISPDDWDDGD